MSISSTPSTPSITPTEPKANNEELRDAVNSGSVDEFAVCDEKESPRTGLSTIDIHNKRAFLRFHDAIDLGEPVLLIDLPGGSVDEMRDAFGDTNSFIDECNSAGYTCSTPVNYPIAADEDGMVALHRAAREGDIERLKALLPMSDPKVADEEGWTALHFAAREGYTDCLRALLPVSDASSADRDGWTPLHLAALNGRTDCLQALLLVSDEKTVSKMGETALDLAKKEGFDDCVSLIEAHLAELEGAAIAGHIKRESSKNRLPSKKARSL